MWLINFLFEFTNRFARFYRSRACQASRPVETRLRQVLQVRIGFGEYFAAHVSIIVYLTVKKYQINQEVL